MFKTLLRSSALTAGALGTSVGYLHFSYRSPVTLDLPSKDRKIVVIGSGIIGLSTAYYLSKNPENKIVILERDDKPYQRTSFQNGCYFHTQGAESWINKPFYLFL